MQPICIANEPPEAAARLRGRREVAGAAKHVRKAMSSGKLHRFRIAGMGYNFVYRNHRLNLETPRRCIDMAETKQPPTATIR